MTPAEIIARACTPTPDECGHGSGSLGPSGGDFACHMRMWERELPRAKAILRALLAAGYDIVGPDDAKLIETALRHASFALDGVVALDDEDLGADDGSDTCQHTKKTVDRALKRLRSLMEVADVR